MNTRSPDGASIRTPPANQVGAPGPERQDPMQRQEGRISSRRRATSLRLPSPGHANSQTAKNAQSRSRASARRAMSSISPLILRSATPAAMNGAWRSPSTVCNRHGQCRSNVEIDTCEAQQNISDTSLFLRTWRQPAGLCPVEQHLLMACTNTSSALTSGSPSHPPLCMSATMLV